MEESPAENNDETFVRGIDAGQQPAAARQLHCHAAERFLFLFLCRMRFDSQRMRFDCSFDPIPYV